MKKDYHMHPTVVQDPGRLKAFVEKALFHGIQEICITDHMPLHGNTASDRIPAGRVSEYCKTVRALAQEYESDISIKLGSRKGFLGNLHDLADHIVFGAGSTG